MARSRKVSRKKRSAKRKTSRKVAKRCPPGCVKKPMLLTDNGKIILGSTRAAKPKRKVSRKVSRKRRSVKRKVSRKKRSVKRKVSRKRRSVKRKASRKVSRKRRSVKRKSRKRKSAKRKASRKRKSAKRKASRKRKSAKRKASRKKTRNSPPSGVIKKQNLGVGSVMVGQDGKTMYKVVEITMRGKPVKKWAKMKFKMGQLFCRGQDDEDCPLVKGVSYNQIETIKRLSNNIKKLFVGAQRDRNKIQKLTNQDTFLSLKGEKPKNEEEIAGLKESMIGKSKTALHVKRNLDDRVLEINKKGLFGVTRLQELAKQNKANVDETKRRIEILQNRAKNDQENFKQRLKRLKKRLSKGGMTRELMAKWEQYEEEERKKEKRKSRR